jgi:hypothetical protein
MFKRDRRQYMGYTIEQSFFSTRWLIQQGREYIARAPSAFDAVEFIDDICDAAVKERLLRGDMTAIADVGERPGRSEAIMGKNPSVTEIAENIARAARALQRLGVGKDPGEVR